VLLLREYRFDKLPALAPPEPTGWERAWHGFYQMKKTVTENGRQQWHGLFDQDPYDAFVLEAFALMTILEQIGPRPIAFFELGSGRAPWCMAVAGAIRFGLVENAPTACRLLAAEAEPVHYQWTCEHLSKQGIAAEVVRGAVTDRVGRCRFKADTDPAAHMGQFVTPQGNLEVPTYTIDYLRESFRFDRVDIIHMDIQGMEVRALHGAADSLAKERIDHLIIGTHVARREAELRALLAPTHDLLVDLPGKQTLTLPGISRPFLSRGDGVQVYRRRGLAYSRSEPGSVPK
jgi:FkbM family methyltransferase